MSYSSHSLSTFVLSLFGVWISFYSQYVKKKSQNDDSYKAFCDIGSIISCSKVFRSEYGDGFGLLPDKWKLSNGECGVMFYSVLTLLSFTTQESLVKLQLFLSCLSVSLSVYLAFVLFLILKDICVVCIATYLLNIAILIQICRKFALLEESDHIKVLKILKTSQ